MVVFFERGITLLRLVRNNSTVIAHVLFDFCNRIWECETRGNKENQTFKLLSRVFGKRRRLGGESVSQTSTMPPPLTEFFAHTKLFDTTNATALKKTITTTSCFSITVSMVLVMSNSFVCSYNFFQILGLFELLASEFGPTNSGIPYFFNLSKNDMECIYCTQLQVLLHSNGNSMKNYFSVFWTFNL